MNNVVAVASGKGGVSNSNVSVNVAVDQAQAVASVGLLDAEVYGPNIPIMMRVRRVPKAVNKKILPLEAHGGRRLCCTGPKSWRSASASSTIRWRVKG